MFEWLIGREHEEDNFWGEVTGFNTETKKVILKGVEEIDNKEVDKTMELDLFTSYFQQNIDCYENWENKIYKALVRNGSVTFHIFSTEENSGDSWFLNIFRHKTLLPTNEYSESVIIINYVIEFCGEVKGEILSLQARRLGEVPKTDEEKLFERWIDEQIENVLEFNHDGYWNTFASVVLCDAFSAAEEIKFAYDLFGEQKLGLKREA